MDTNKEFWTDSYNRNIKKLIGICYRYVSDLEMAEDLAHDSILTAMKKADTFKGKGHFDAWLRKITVNTALQYLREMKTVQEIQQEVIRQESVNNDENMALVYDFTTRELLEAINKLPEHHRLVFNLYVIDGFSHKQIAAQLNISIGTSKSHLARGKKKLQLILNKNTDEQKKKKSLFLLLFPYGSGKINRLYRSKFFNFEIAPKNTTFLEKVAWNNLKNPRFISVFTIANGIVAFGVVAVVSGIFLLGNKNETDNLIDTPPPQQIIDTLSTREIIDTVPKKADTPIKTEPKQSPATVFIKKKRITHKKVIIHDTLTVTNTSHAD